MNNNSFSLKSTSSEFTQRQKNVFDKLKIIENNRDNTTMEIDMETTNDDIDDVPESNRRNPRIFTKNYRGKESIFKKPQDPASRNFIKRIPDFKKNPHKWTRYSLEDVKDEDISDKGNARAAMSFLRELKDRKERETESVDNSNTSRNKVVFKKHTFISTKINANSIEESKPTFKSSKLIMPEYVVGNKAKKEKKNRALRGKVSKELKLDHLQEIEADDE